MKWCSIDPSNRSGIAYWEDGKLLRTDVLRKVGTKGKYSVGDEMFTCRWAAWCFALHGQSMVVTEEGCGRFATAIKSQAGIRAYVDAVCDFYSFCGDYVSFHVVNVSEWRRVIKEEFGVSWPATRERKKELSISLVKDRFGIEVSDDEADAVLLGLAAIRMRLVDVNASKEAAV